MKDFGQSVFLYRNNRDIAIQSGQFRSRDLFRLFFRFGKPMEDVFGDIKGFGDEDAIAHGWWVHCQKAMVFGLWFMVVTFCT